MYYVDFRDKTIKTEISVSGSQALGAERLRSPSLAVKVLIHHFVFICYSKAGQVLKRTGNLLTRGYRSRDNLDLMVYHMTWQV